MSNRALPIVEQEDLHDVLGEGQNGRLGDDVVQGNIGCLCCFSGKQPCDGGEQELGPDLLLYAERGLGVEGVNSNSGRKLQLAAESFVPL